MAIADWTPSLADIANLTFARARGRWAGGDTEVNPATFDQPDRVASVIAMATSIVAPQLGGETLDPQFYGAAKAIICLKAAYMLEPGAWPEQAKVTPELATMWGQQYAADLAGLVGAVSRFRDDGDDGPGATQLPIGSFPPPGLSSAPLCSPLRYWEDW